MPARTGSPPQEEAQEPPEPRPLLLCPPWLALLVRLALQCRPLRILNRRADRPLGAVLSSTRLLGGLGLGHGRRDEKSEGDSNGDSTHRNLRRSGKAGRPESRWHPEHPWIAPAMDSGRDRALHYTRHRRRPRIRFRNVFARHLRTVGSTIAPPSITWTAAAIEARAGRLLHASRSARR